MTIILQNFPNDSYGSVQSFVNVLNVVYQDTFIVCEI